MAAALGIDLHGLGTGHALGEAQGDDAACGGPGDHVKVLGDGDTAEKIALDLCQVRGRQQALDPTTVDGQDAEKAILRPSLLDAGAVKSAVRATGSDIVHDVTSSVC